MTPWAAACRVSEMTAADQGTARPNAATWHTCCACLFPAGHDASPLGPSLLRHSQHLQAWNRGPRICRGALRLHSTWLCPGLALVLCLLWLRPSLPPNVPSLFWPSVQALRRTAILSRVVPSQTTFDQFHFCLKLKHRIYQSQAVTA